ncbi:Microtubule-associated protein tortifolia1 [Thalictrum thalictroides]|uniref:Microtubule-associated protein tortifolia1 n=1 Tax=Thalictrum thalictroides TaxID=46969 RepID=A0A7J6V5X8_THATH|nr:Microtubule-associated protein tortifolia1 [Thalictrum thalictroides]
MIELKQRILISISKLSDRDTYQIGVQDLENVIQTISSDGVSMLLNCLYDVSGDPKPSVKKEVLRLISLLVTSHSDFTSTHLTKIIAHIVKRLKDSDSGVRDSCRDAIGALSLQYLRGNGDNGNLGSVVSLFVKPLFETMNEEKKAIQAGAAMCMARMVECAVDVPVSVLQKLVPRICKCLNSENFLAKAALLSVVANLSKVRGIASQSMPTLLQTVLDCLKSNDWTSRKAAADTLIALASHASQLITERASSHITALEACRFDKMKPVRESIIEALQLWKKIAEKESDGISDSPNFASCEAAVSITKQSLKRSNLSDGESDAAKIELTGSSTSSDMMGSSISDKAVPVLKKKTPTLSHKEVNTEFFQKFETKGSGDFPVEVAVSRRLLNSSNIDNEEKSNQNDTAYRGKSSHNETNGLGDAHISSINIYHNAERGGVGMFNKQQDVNDFARDRWTELKASRRKDFTDKAFDVNGTDVTSGHKPNARIMRPRTESNAEGSFLENAGNWITIQRQLSQLERQQFLLMNLLQDFMGGSHDNMITLENRVRGLERIVENMQGEISSGRRVNYLMVGLKGTSHQPLDNYNSLSDYFSSRSGRVGDLHSPYTERFLLSDGLFSGVSERDQLWISEESGRWNSFPYGTSRNGYVGSRLENNGDQVSKRKAWDKGPGHIRLGEGPSARSIWHASKDEATLDAIRGAGDENRTSRPAKQVPIPELTAEAMGDNCIPRQNQGSAIWSNVIEAVDMGNMDLAYAEVLSTEDDIFLVKLMDRSGPVFGQLSNEIAIEILHAVGQMLLEQSLFDVGLPWIQQLVDLVMENGADVLPIPFENKRKLLLSLRKANPPQTWEGQKPEQLLLQLASAWKVNLQQ